MGKVFRSKIEMSLQSLINFEKAINPSTLSTRDDIIGKSAVLG